ncbi:MAG: 2-C-methyl-D-erythritol 2,4-cyclodiphosphate synthase [Bacteroidales bacterium]|nr:2-C-methyl-D-erythritol 2,4-cyclodiphosphate synthase [Bacteroidales bacterium]
MQKIRIGFGIDVHRLQEGSTLRLGGVSIPFHKSLEGHSDADVLLHAICDALLGAANLRDIGVQFPDNSNTFKGIDSLILLKKTAELIQNKGFAIGNIDCTLALQEPKIAPYIPQMQTVISQTLQIPPDDISIKATTTEHLGYEGRGEGVTAYAVALLERG